MVLTGGAFVHRQHVTTNIRNHCLGLRDNRLGFSNHCFGICNRHVGIRNHHVGIRNHQVGINCKLGLKEDSSVRECPPEPIKRTLNM